METIDGEAVDALGDEILDWRFKAVPASAHGSTVREYARSRRPLEEFGTPLMTLDAGALDHNLRLMAGWTRAAGVRLAPHGKTTMAPQLWRRQLDAGAWAVTVANLPQLRVARAFGVRRVLLANALLDPAGLAWLAAELERCPDFTFLSWVDSVRAVELMNEALRHCHAQRQVDVCVELGAPAGGRACGTPTRPSRWRRPYGSPLSCGWWARPGTRARSRTTRPPKGWTRSPPTCARSPTCTRGFRTRPASRS